MEMNKTGMGVDCLGIYFLETGAVRIEIQLSTIDYIH